MEATALLPRPHTGQAAPSPGIAGTSQAHCSLLPSAVCSVPAAEGNTAQRDDGLEGNLLTVAGISPANWFYFPPLGACLAVTTCGALTDSKTTEILQQELLQEESKRPAAQERAPNEGREEKCTWTKAKNPPTPWMSEAAPSRGTLNSLVMSSVII